MATKRQLLAWELGDDVDLADEPILYYIKCEDCEEDSSSDHELAEEEATSNDDSSPTSDSSASAPPSSQDDGSATSLNKLRVGQGFVLSAHAHHIARASQSTINIIEPFDAFAQVVVKYTNMPLFNTVRTYDDLDKLNEEPVYCEETSAAVVYADFVKLPPLADRPLDDALALLLEAIFATYIGFSGQADRRAGQHRRGPRVAPKRLFYRFLAIAIDSKMVGVMVVPCEDQFELDFYSAYGKRGDFALRWSARELLVAFLSSFEAVYIASKFAFRGNDAYLQHLEAYTGCEAPESIIGLNSTNGFANFLACYQGQQRARAAKKAGLKDVEILPKPSREFVVKAMVEALRTSGRLAYINLGAGEDFGNLYLPTTLLSSITVLRINKVDLAILGLDKIQRPSQASVLVRLEPRDPTQPFVFMGSIEDALFFYKWSLVVEYEGRLLVLSWKRGTFCPTTASQLAKVLSEHPTLGQAEVADLPRPDFLAAEDLELNVSPTVKTWSRRRRLQAETSIQGSLARSVSACPERPGFYAISLIEGDKNRLITLPADEEGRLPANLYAVICVSPSNGLIRYAYKARDDHSPVQAHEWRTYRGPRCRPLQLLVNDACDIRGLDEIDQWDTTSTGYWPYEVVARRLRAGRFPVARDARPFGHTMKPPKTLGRDGTKKEPVFLEVILKEDDEEDEMWWWDPKTGKREAHNLKRKGGNPGRAVVEDLRKHERGEVGGRKSKKARVAEKKE